MKGVHGYKVFHSDWSCGVTACFEKQYHCPGKFEEEVEVKLCARGMHFCERITDCFNYYSFDPSNKVAEVIAYGDVVTKGDKSATNKLEIVREISWDEVLSMLNVGEDCTGFKNTGKANTGNFNTGNFNIGNFNTGDLNTGDCNNGNYNIGNRNIGDNNTGYMNTGDWNTGHCNTGNRNTGNRNTGDWNKSCYNTGCFMTEEQNIMMFNKPSDWTYRMWLNSEARCLMSQVPKDALIWILSEHMSDEEKTAHPEYKTTGGYLKVIDASDRVQTWWDDLSDQSKEVIKSLPNFDPDIFYQCTGIKVD